MIENMKKTLGAALLTLAIVSIPQLSLGGDSVKERFDWYCAQCHGVTGAGDGINSVDELPVGPMDLSVSKEIKKFTNDQIIGTLTHGGPTNNLDPLMPPWGNTFSESEIKELMLYVRSLCKGDGCPSA